MQHHSYLIKIFKVTIFWKTFCLNKHLFMLSVLNWFYLIKYFFFFSKVGFKFNFEFKYGLIRIDFELSCYVVFMWVLVWLWPINHSINWAVIFQVAGVIMKMLYNEKPKSSISRAFRLKSVQVKERLVNAKAFLNFGAG